MRNRYIHRVKNRKGTKRYKWCFKGYHMVRVCFQMDYLVARYGEGTLRG